MQVTIEIPDGLPANLIREKIQEIQEMFANEVQPLTSENENAPVKPMELQKEAGDQNSGDSLSWRGFFEKTPLASDDFLSEREDSLPQSRDGLLDVHA